MKGAEKIKLLLVEDEFIIAKWTMFLLEQQNYQVEVVSNGEAAIDYVHEAEDIGLILMDMDLGPGINGKETAEIIRREKKLPIIFYTNYYKEDIFDEISVKEQFGYVNKCSNKVYLFKAIEESLCSPELNC